MRCGIKPIRSGGVKPTWAGGVVIVKPTWAGGVIIVRPAWAGGVIIVHPAWAGGRVGNRLSGGIGIWFGARPSGVIRPCSTIG